MLGTQCMARAEKKNKKSTSSKIEDLLCIFIQEEN